MRTNTAATATAKTHGGAAAFPHLKPIERLKRSVMATMLWEGQFYEGGKSIAERIAELSVEVTVGELSDLAIHARVAGKLRHVPLLLAAELAKRGRGSPIVSETIREVIRRPDELGELLSLYWKDGKRPIAKQLQKGLAKAFRKFDAYQLAKYNRDEKIKLRDVLFLSHAKPANEAQAAVWKQLVDGTLPAPDTWESAAVAGKDKIETFRRLLGDGKMGALAILRNLKAMRDAGMDKAAVFAELCRLAPGSGILPFQFISAARAVPDWSDKIEEAMLSVRLPRLTGKTILVVDVSGSMQGILSTKSGLMRLDAAAALAMMASEMADDVTMYATAGSDAAMQHKTLILPAYRGFAIGGTLQASLHAMGGGGIFLTQAMRHIESDYSGVAPDRVIVITDEQDCDRRLSPASSPLLGKRNYLVNIASYQNGINFGNWTQVNGFSEETLRWIAADEAVAQ